MSETERKVIIRENNSVKRGFGSLPACQTVRKAAPASTRRESRPNRATCRNLAIAEHDVQRLRDFSYGEHGECDDPLNDGIAVIIIERADIRRDRSPTDKHLSQRCARFKDLTETLEGEQ